MSVESKIMAAMFARSDAKRDKGLRIPEDIIRTSGIIYGPDRDNHVLDVFRPARAAEEKTILPLLVVVHGGGYVYGGITQYQFYSADLARRGFAVICYNYRLAPEHRFPAPLEDLNLVMSWAAKHAAEYGFDCERTVMVGDSAGAQILSQYAAIVTTPEYMLLMDMEIPDFHLRAVGLNCGMYDLAKEADPPKGIYKDYLGDDLSIYGDKLDVLGFIGKMFPPAYLISAPGDFLVKNCAPMTDFLQCMGVPCEYRIYGDQKTGHVFHLDMRSALAHQANDDEIAFFRKYL